MINSNNLFKNLLSLLAITCCSLPIPGQEINWSTENEIIEARVDSLMHDMTRDEKIGQLLLYSLDFSKNITDGGVPKSLAWYKSVHAGCALNVFDDDLKAVQEQLGKASRPGIPVLTMIDAVNGHSFYPGATIFPSQLALSHSWNPALLKDIGRITAIEMAATGIHLNFGPGIDVCRDLRWGRVGETYGEDPYLTGALGVARLQGLQGENLSDPGSVAACVKHFVGYGETIGGRDATACALSERDLRINHLPPFKKAIQEGQTASVMAAYNAVLGVPASSNAWLLNDLLRGEYGFDGLVISDWENYSRLMDTHLTSADSVEAAIQIIAAGNDVPMSSYQLPGALKKALESGRLDPKIIDEACRRVLRLKFKLGLFDHPEKLFPHPEKEKILASAEHIDIALEAAVQSIVLLENKNDVLPLNEKELSRIAVIGPNADNIVAQLGDWSLGFRGQGPWQNEVAERTRKHTTVLQGLKKKLSPAIQIDFTRGCDIKGTDQKNIPHAVELAQQSDVIIAVVGDDRSLTGEQQDRAVMELTGDQLELLRELGKLDQPLITIMMASKPLLMSQVAAYSDALLLAVNPGMAGGEAITELLLGDRNPSGKLTVTIPHHIGQMPANYNQPPGWHGVGYYVDLPSETKKPQYSFGYGLSYTKFEYSNLALDHQEIQADQAVRGRFTITNTGDVAGVEIAQMYLEDRFASVIRPEKILKGFDRITLQPGESKNISFEIQYDELALLTQENKWHVEPGDFVLHIGSSVRAEDLKLNAAFTVR